MSVARARSLLAQQPRAIRRARPRDTSARPTAGSSGAAMQTISLLTSGSAAEPLVGRRACRGSRRRRRGSGSASSTVCWLPTSSVSPISGCRSENARISGGTNDSAAVVTAMMPQPRAPRPRPPRAPPGARRTAARRHRSRRARTRSRPPSAAPRGPTARTARSRARGRAPRSPRRPWLRDHELVGGRRHRAAADDRQERVQLRDSYSHMANGNAGSITVAISDVSPCCRRSAPGRGRTRRGRRSPRPRRKARRRTRSRPRRRRRRS